jgi:hypothetical protein
VVSQNVVEDDVDHGKLLWNTMTVPCASTHPIYPPDFCHGASGRAGQQSFNERLALKREEMESE